MAKYLKFLNVLVLIISFNFINACNKKDTLTSVAYSDNKTFNKRKYDEDVPFRPLGNLTNDDRMKKQDVAFYENYVVEGYKNLEQNDAYFIWLNNERMKRLERGEKNDFKRETVPGMNNYYIQRSRTFKENNVSVSERRYVDTIIKLDEAKKDAKERAEITLTKDDEIADYEIINYNRTKSYPLSVAPDDYEE